MSTMSQRSVWRSENHGYKCRSVMVHEYFSPDRAEKLLANSPGNRGLTDKKLKELRKALNDKEFHPETGETIKFDTNGDVRDGHHRLQACVDTGEGFYSWVMYELTEEALLSVDTGKSRSLGDIVTLRGGKNAHSQGAAASWILTRICTTAEKPMGKATPSHKEADAFLRDHPELNDMVIFCKYRANPVSVAMTAALYWIFSQKDPAVAKKFMEDFKDPSHLPAKDPVRVLHAEIAKMPAGSSHAKLETLAANFIHAWNYRRKGDKITSLPGLIYDEQSRGLIPIPV